MRPDRPQRHSCNSSQLPADSDAALNDGLQYIALTEKHSTWLNCQTSMDRVRRWIAPPNVEYEPIHGHVVDEDGAHTPLAPESGPSFSRTVYWLFFLLGVSMLWAWYVFDSVPYPEYLLIRSAKP